MGDGDEIEGVELDADGNVILPERVREAQEQDEFGDSEEEPPPAPITRPTRAR